MEKVTTYHNARKFKSCIVCQFIVILLRLRLTAAAEFITTLIKTQDLFTEVILKILESIRLELKFYEYYDFDFIEIYFIKPLQYSSG